jgi:prophage DNA circulation protein
MSTIRDLPSAWRQDLVLASFKNALFHCESNARESGRRIVMHEFPKKEFPYAEDMGRRAKSFIIRGYCIQYPFNSGNALFARDYREARNILRDALDREGPGVLVLPLARYELVVCSQYRLTEEEKFGGYCVFDMQFQELGVDPREGLASTQAIADNAIRYAKEQMGLLTDRLDNPTVDRTRPGPPAPTLPGL